MVLPHQHGLRTVALFEAFKGALVLAAGFGLLTLLGHDAQQAAERLVHRMHLNPAHHYPQVFINAMSAVDDAKLWLMAGLAALYSLMRFIEGYGLWHNRVWAQWFAALSGAVYVPVELWEIFHRATWLKFILLTVNLAIVIYMARLLIEARRAKQADHDPA